MMELAVGLREGYTGESMRSLESAAGPRSLIRERVTVASRMGMIGDMWGRRLITETMKDRARSSAAMAAIAPAPPPPPPVASRPPGKGALRPALRHHEYPVSGMGPHPSRGPAPQARKPPCSTPAPPPDEDTLPPSEEVVSETAVQTAMPAGSMLGRGVEEELDALGEDFVTYKSLPPRGLKSDRVKPPPTRVPDRLPPGSSEDTKARKQLGFILRVFDLKRRGLLCEEALLGDPEFEKYVLAELVNPEDSFRFGNIHVYREYWKSYLESTLGKEVVRSNRAIQDLLKLLEEGVVPDWAPPGRPESEKHPEHDKRRESVRRMLSKHMPSEEAEEKLDALVPQEVFLPNLSSVHAETKFRNGEVADHAAFVSEQIQELVADGRLAQWHFPEGRMPRCVLPLGVAVRELQMKLRMIFDGRYINLWLKYKRFKYETVQDVLNYVAEGGYGSVSDYKAGYHHIACPALSEYLGICWEGQVYTYQCLPFGVSLACRLFTEINTIMYRPLREAGVHLTTYIDDRFSANLSKGGAKQDVLLIFAVMAICGWFVTLKKSIIVPAQRIEFLGLIIDLLAGKFELPQKKMDLLIRQIEMILSGERNATPKELQSVAGRISAARLAVHVAPLLCWELFQEVSRRAKANDLTPPPLSEALAGALQFAATALRKYNGSRFWKRLGGLVFAGDAGEMGAGGFDVEGNLPAPMQISYTEEQTKQIATHEFHSTAREILNVLHAYRCLLGHFPSKVQSSRLTYLTDSQAAYYAIMGMRVSSRRELETVTAIWTECADNDTDLAVRWCARDHPLLKRADDQTRMVDNTSWGVDDRAVNQVLADLEVDRSQIQLDPFSEDCFKQAERYFSLYAHPTSAGVDGFSQKWLNPDGTKAFCWVNGPFSMMGQVLRKIKEEQANCILIAPKWPKSWRSILFADLPITGVTQVKRPKDAEGKPQRFCIPGSRLSPEVRQKAQYWSVQAYLIRFD